MKKGTKFMMMLLVILLIFGLFGCTNEMNNQQQNGLLGTDLKLDFITQYPLGLSEYCLSNQTRTNQINIVELEANEGNVYPKIITVNSNKPLKEKVYFDGPCQKLTIRVKDTNGDTLEKKVLDLKGTHSSEGNDLRDFNVRVYGNFLNGLYIKETQGQVVNIYYYSMALIDGMSNEEKVALISKLLQVEEDESWFVLANYHGHYFDFEGGMANWPIDDDPFENFDEWVYDVEEEVLYSPETGERKYTLTLNKNPISGGNVSGEGTYEAGENVNITATSAEGYHFINWMKNGVELSTQANDNYVMPAENVTLVAIFEIDTETLLKDLGTEGVLQEEGNVYNILDNTLVGYWSVSIKPERLPEPYKYASDWKLVIGEDEFQFTPNLFDDSIYDCAIDDTIAEKIENVRNASFKAS